MKKILISMIAVVLTIVCAYFAYMYYNGPKIVDGVVSERIDVNGKPNSITTVFSPEDTIFYSAKVNRFWIKKAQVVWYKGDVLAANRFQVETSITVNRSGYFTTSLSVPEGLDEGPYTVGIFVAGKKIMETQIGFEVKR